MKTQPKLLLALLFSLFLVACDTAEQTELFSTPSPIDLTAAAMPRQKLRLINQSKYTLRMVVLRFPASQVAFNDLVPGQASVVRDLPYGIYSQAEFSAKVDTNNYYDDTGMSWAGQAPLKGSAFTFVIDVDPKTMRIVITKVTTDAP